MSTLRCSSPALLLLAAAFVQAPFVRISSAQVVTSARSGTLHYFDGDVSIDGVAASAKPGRFAEIKENGVLRTGLGRAEILLTPGVFLRVGENSSVRMLDARLLSTRVEVLSGAVMVESDDPRMSLENSPVTLVYSDYQVRIAKHGLVGISAAPAQVKVFKGEAEVIAADSKVILKEGHETSFASNMVPAKFDVKTADDLYLWARDRSQNLSAASMASARMISNGFTGTSGNWNGGWYLNNYLGSYSYVPANGTLWNAWGFGFFSPGSVFNYYDPSAYYYLGAGTRGAGAIGRPILASGTALQGGLPQRGWASQRGAALDMSSAQPSGFGGAGIAAAPAGVARGAGAAAPAAHGRAR